MSTTHTYDPISAVCTRADTTPTFTVEMSPEIADELDECFSPMDGIAALDAVYLDLPKQHRTRRSLWPFPRVRGHRLYRARMAWYPCMGVEYIQIESTLQIVELWCDYGMPFWRRYRVDCTIGGEDAGE